jgi:hypothetical protein
MLLLATLHVQYFCKHPCFSWRSHCVGGPVVALNLAVVGARAIAGVTAAVFAALLLLESLLLLAFLLLLASF